MRLPDGSIAWPFNLGETLSRWMDRVVPGKERSNIRGAVDCWSETAYGWYVAPALLVPWGFCTVML